jgi:hypothetical protein
MAYTTVSDYLTEAQALIQDVGAIRYSTSRYVAALNAGLAEGFRTRPDFYRTLTDPPAYEVGDINAALNWPKSYALPLILYIVGHVELTDNQGNEDSRAAAFMTAFIAKLTKAGS